MTTFAPTLLGVTNRFGPVPMPTSGQIFGVLRLSMVLCRPSQEPNMPNKKATKPSAAMAERRFAPRWQVWGLLLETK